MLCSTAMYCMGTFSLMLLSLLETVVVTYLLAKDSVLQKTETDKDHNEKEDKTRSFSCDRGETFKRSNSNVLWGYDRGCSVL